MKKILLISAIFAMPLLGMTTDEEEWTEITEYDIQKIIQEDINKAQDYITNEYENIKKQVSLWHDRLHKQYDEKIAALENELQDPKYQDAAYKKLKAIKEKAINDYNNLKKETTKILENRLSSLEQDYKTSESILAMMKQGRTEDARKKIHDFQQAIHKEESGLNKLIEKITESINKKYEKLTQQPAEKSLQQPRFWNLQYWWAEPAKQEQPILTVPKPQETPEPTPFIEQETKRKWWFW
jgi:hypothetical protein